LADARSRAALAPPNRPGLAALGLWDHWLPAAPRVAPEAGVRCGGSGMTSTTLETPALAPRAVPARSIWPQVALILAVALAGALALYLYRPAVITDDTFAFLDWGRDLHNGTLPLLEQRTFHPLPIVAASIVTLIGSSAPTATMILSLTSLMLLAIAAWVLMVQCGLRQPAPLLAGALVLLNPAMLFLGLTAYINIFFAAFVVWGIVAEIEGRTRLAWGLLIAGALIRPEGWAFLGAYGALRWWTLGRPLSPRRWIVIALLVLGPPLIWTALEWRLFNDPFYSFHVTTTPAIKATGTGTLSGISSTLHEWVGVPVLAAAAVGIVVVALAAPRRVAVRLLGASAVGAVTILVLSKSNFNLPSRQYSVVITLICALAAAGACAPMLLAARGLGRVVATAVGILCAAALVVVSIGSNHTRQSTDLHFVRVQYDTRRALDRSIDRARTLIDSSGARKHTVAAFDYTQVNWDLGGRADVATPGRSASTVLILQPSPADDAELATINRQIHLIRAPRGWHVLYDGEWTIFGSSVPARLGR